MPRLRLAIACACLLDEHDELVTPCWAHLNAKRCHIKNGGTVCAGDPLLPAATSRTKGRAVPPDA